MTQKQSPAAAGTAGTGQMTPDRNSDGSATPRGAQPPRKWARLTQAFLDVGQRGLNRFEAARQYRDHVLPTTVSQLEGRGVRILRKDETVPGAFGPVHCCRYWLDPTTAERARELLGAAP